MIRRTEALEKLNAQYRRERFGSLSYEQALAIFAALWDHARRVNPQVSTDWERDIEADIILARVLNGLPVSA